LIDGPVNVPLTLVFEFVAGAVVAAAVIAVAVAAGSVVAAAVAPEPFVATGLALFVAAGVALVVAPALAVEDDDEADALDVAPGPVTGPPAMLIALVVPN
jgi:ribose/xylose/arabinose/galactoside ABC-type transport system permease subunit